MKICCISDTHGKHHQLSLPKADLIIHAGDISKRGKKNEIIDFLNWFSNLDYTYKLFIAGNHDFFFEKESDEKINELIPKNVIYLNDSGVEINGIKFWGSPVQPWYNDWAFNRKRGKEIKQHWDLIPKDTTILITHGPVYGILDRTVTEKNVGCEELLNVVKKIKPRYYISGHIHEAYGTKNAYGTVFINASSLDFSYNLTHPPIEINIT